MQDFGEGIPAEKLEHVFDRFYRDDETSTIPGFGLTRIYTSMIERAVHTAAPTAQALGIPFTVWRDIHEEGGIFSREDESNPLGLPGRTRSYFEQHFPSLSLPAELDETGWWNRPFEAREERQPRADQFLSDLLARHGDREGQPVERVAIVSHGGFFMHLMCAMLKFPWRQASHDLKFWFLLNNCSIGVTALKRGHTAHF